MSTGGAVVEGCPVYIQRYTGRVTTQQVNFRIDEETKAALDELTRDGTPVSDVIRKAIRDARQAARKAQAIAEMQAIMADPEQRRISERTHWELSNLRAW